MFKKVTLFLMFLLLFTSSVSAYELFDTTTYPTLEVSAKSTLKLTYPGLKYTIAYDTAKSGETAVSSNSNIVKVVSSWYDEDDQAYKVTVEPTGVGNATINLTNSNIKTNIIVEDVIPFTSATGMGSSVRVNLSLEKGKNTYQIPKMTLTPSNSNAVMSYLVTPTLSPTVEVDENGLMTAIKEGESTVFGTLYFHEDGQTGRLYGMQVIQYHVTVLKSTGSYMKSVSKSQVKSAYNKYILPYLNQQNSTGALSYNQSALYDSNNHLTTAGYQATLGAVNFLREVVNTSNPVVLKDELNRLSQAGVDYLDKNNLFIDHSAADNSNDEAAKDGLHNSNLHSGGNTVMSPYSYVSDVNNVTKYSIGHRTNLLRSSLKNIGIGSTHSSNAIYVWDDSVWDSDASQALVTSYPNAGYSPVDIITESTGGVPLWNVDVSALGTIDHSKFKLTVSEENGKTITFTKTENPDDAGTWYQGNNNIVFNPYVFTDNGSYESLKNRTFTITLDGVNCPTIGDDKISFKTTFFSMKDEGFNPYIKQTVPGVDSGKSKIYRLYNSVSKEHLYTTSSNEVNTLDSQPDWTYEGVAWNAPESGDGVYRLYSPVTGAHLYTKDTNEVNTLSKTSAWRIDNNGEPLFYSGGATPVYRLYHEGIRMHLLTTDANEYNTLGRSGWNTEGIALNCN